jgi:DNA polymerase-3 subunit gamma/tau
MSYQVLARKYRPQTFSEVIGQDHVTRTLKHAIEQGRIAHGYIFSGHRGIGKTTIARIVAMALNCRSTSKPTPEPCGVCDSCMEIRAGNAVDVVEIDAATNRGIDEIRELRDATRYRPARDRYKIWILDEAHQITDAAFNALLKTLEEPPGHVIFMMATTQPEDIPQTIRSRCQHFSFHAVKFEEIVRQLREIANKEGVKADDDALAMLAEAGDGSMRDALSIMDQAIACCGTTLGADVVRDLVGAVPSEILEQVMQAVARNSSEEALRLVDKLVTEGHNPTHFARQMVRFVRNATVAKIAGGESSLLQISSDERARVSRVAELFGEEDLARFLQILLRTHSELGYKQEQRFHLELGLLKMVHAQRLLPIEEILSGVANPAPAKSSGRDVANNVTPRATPAATPARPGAAAPRGPSPFEADRARKGTAPKPEMSADAQPYSRTATAIAIAADPAPAPAVPPAPASTDVRSAVIGALENAKYQSVATMLAGGEWSTEGTEVVIKVSAGARFVDMAMNAEAKRIANAAATSALSRPMKVRVAPGQAVPDAAPPRPSNGGPGARSRAAEDPVVRRMREKFGAEIRTVIDHKEKGR